MDLREALRVIRKHLRMILAVFIASVSVASYYGYTSPKIYQSSISMFVTAQSGSMSDNGQLVLDDAYSRAQLSIDRVKSYAIVISGPRVADEVSKRLQLKDPTALPIYPHISANAPAETVLINVAVTDTDPKRAQVTANMVGEVVVDLVDKLERPTGTERSSIRIAVVEPAGLPVSPIAPRKKLMVLMGGFFGMAAGIAISVLRDKLDTSIKNPEELAAVTHAPVLGVIAYDARTPKRPLVVHTDSRSPTAESYRQLRTNIRFVNIDSTVRSLVITSAVSNEGKSTVACNLALAMAQAGQRVILVEADLRKPSVRHYMGIEGAVGLTNVLLGEVELEDVLQ
ncbi:MAG: P-loop NTPase, partial [Actinomycetota bacterium]